MAKSYRANTFARINNAMISYLLRLGIKVWSFSLLTVRGRKSGKPIMTPIAVFVQDQKRYLVAPYGVVNWVCNLRAAGGEATLTRRRHSERIHAIELEPEVAAPLFREAQRSGPPGIPAVIFRVYRSLSVFPYLNVTEHSSLEEFEREVLTHPVFLLQPAMEHIFQKSSPQSQKTNQPVEKVLVEFIEDHMSLAEHQFTPRRYTSKEKIFRQKKERVEVDKREESAVQ